MSSCISCICILCYCDAWLKPRALHVGVKTLHNTQVNQCRINNRRNVVIATSPTVLCVRFVLSYMPRWVLEFRCPRQTLRNGAIYFKHTKTKILFVESTLNFSFVRRKSSFHIANCLKSFDFKLFFVYTLKLLRSPI